MVLQRLGRNAGKLGLLALAVLIGISVSSTPELQKVLRPGLDDVRLAALRALLVGVGGALIGATAIVFSVVMLAVQLNFARIPHGLFRKLSTDLPLLACFAATFVLGASVGLASMFPDADWVAAAIVTAGWSTFLALLLFLLAYRRALDLISPAKQLSMVFRKARRSIATWDRLASRSAPLLSRRKNRERGDRDMGRASFFRGQVGWETTTREAVVHAMSFARGYAEQGEYDVSGAALGIVVGISDEYVKARGRTFFPSNPFFDNPLSSEAFISDTLEQLRRLALVAQTRGDEEQFTQVLATMAHLARVYAKIDYGQDLGIGLHHSQLAGGYLAQAVESSVRSFGPDVLMDGIRHLGAVALILVLGRQSSGAATIGKRMAAISLVGLVKPGFEPVTSCGVEQLAKLSFSLLTGPELDVKSASDDVRSSISLVGNAVLGTGDGGLQAKHRGYMAPYYSLAAHNTFGDLSTKLVNSLIGMGEEDESAERALDHLADWSDGMYEGEKKLLLAAVEKRSSSLTFDLVHWISHFTTILVTAANAPAASHTTKEKLLENAVWLISVLDWLPSDKESLSVLQGSRVEELLFEVAMEAQTRGAHSVADAARDTLLRWAFKNTLYQFGRHTFTQAMSALVTMIAWRQESDWTRWLESEVKVRVAKSDLDPEEREKLAKEIRRRGDDRGRGRFSISPVDQTLQHVDRARFAQIIASVADILQPASPPPTGAIPPVPSAEAPQAEPPPPKSPPVAPPPKAPRKRSRGPRVSKGKRPE